MSIAFSPTRHETNVAWPHDATSKSTLSIHEVLNSVEEAVAPVWPLKDYVAVNPYGGFGHQSFLQAREYLQSLSDCETLMPLSYYRERYRQGTFGLAELDAAIDDMVEDQIPGAETLCANVIHTILLADHDSSDPTDDSPRKASRLQSIAEFHDQIAGTDWTATIHEEISKHCAAHYDEGQASWPSPWKHLPLYQAWRSAARHDRKMEILGIRNFRDLVGKLPHHPDAAIVWLLSKLGVPARKWKNYLLCLALNLPGWSAWTKYKTVEARKQGDERADLAGLLAIRLAYDVALSRGLEFHVDFKSDGDHDEVTPSGVWSQQTLVGFTLLRANEIAFRTRVLSGMRRNLLTIAEGGTNEAASVGRKLAQMVFCIDVRSERLRRNLEATSDQVETFGFAGFFGLPIEFVRLGETSGTNQLPVLVDSQFQVHEEIRSDEPGNSAQTNQRRTRVRALRKAWKRFQASAVSCFAFVETTGLFYGGVLLRKALGQKSSDAKFDGVRMEDRDRLGPSFRDLHRQGLSTTRQADLAETILTNLGLVDNFAKFVVLCGHASQTENNPLQAGLDCGACGGHSGEPNARFAAMLLNQPYVRQTLAKRGIDIPADVHFLAGLHNTTTDVIKFFDLDLVPESHRGFLEELVRHSTVAGQRTRLERLPLLPGRGEASLFRRGTDWSEVRPEWGLSGNAAFIVGPRGLTRSLNLKGESFLHSYDFRLDADGKTLEQIMTAPMVVANWINMQYYASTVDQKHFGSGCKTIHNVVGKFGILSGNGGDLQTGLPWQSIHDGNKFQHDPVRLLGVIAAPRDSISRVLANHANVRDLVVNGWVQLVAIDNGNFYRYSSRERWEPLIVGASTAQSAFASAT